MFIGLFKDMCVGCVGRGGIFHDCACIDKGTTYKSNFFPSFKWVLGREPMPSSLGTNAFTH